MKILNPAASALMFATLLMTACAALPDKPVRAVTYDFGPGTVAASAVQAINASTALPPVALAEIDSSLALNGNAVLYRLMYFNAQELRPYAQARWSMPPAQLLRQRLSAQLGKTRAVLNPGDGVAGSTSPWAVRLELEEFSQLFESTTASVGLLRMRATVVQATAQGEKLLGQRSFVVQRPAPSADVAGGVQALTGASDAVVLEVDQWLQTLQPSR
jgi:cholesterol transport system auxiliary component